MRTDRLVQEYDVALRYTMFPLHPDTPEEGRSLVDLFGGRQAYLHSMRERLVSLMEAEGLEYGDRTHTYNSRLGQELAKWAERQPGGRGGGGKIHDALYRAYFVGGVNLANVDELVRIAESLDLSGDEAREVLQTRAERQAVDLDWERSRQLGVTGVPTFMVDTEVVVGAQPYEILEALVTRAGARKRAVSNGL